MLDLLMNHVGFGLFGRYHRGDVLQEINAALFALAALPLFMAARGALATQGGVTAWAKPCDVTRLAAAFRAVHRSILAGIKTKPEDWTPSLRLHG